MLPIVALVSVGHEVGGLGVGEFELDAARAGGEGVPAPAMGGGREGKERHREGEELHGLLAAWRRGEGGVRLLLEECRGLGATQSCGGRGGSACVIKADAGLELAPRCSRAALAQSKHFDIRTQVDAKSQDPAFWHSHRASPRRACTWRVYVEGWKQIVARKLFFGPTLANR